MNCTVTLPAWLNAVALERGINFSQVLQDALKRQLGSHDFMKKLFFPAIFHTTEEGGYYVTFPDFPECITEGDDLQNAYEMTVNALGFAITSRLHDKEPLPQASALNTLPVSSGDSIIIVEFDLA